MSKPRRACILNLQLEADTREAMAQALCNLVYMIEAEKCNGPAGCMGGVDAGYSYEIAFSDHPTHEEYVQQLEDYLGAKP